MNKLVCSLFAVGAAALCVSAAPEPNEEAQLAQALANYEVTEAIQRAWERFNVRWTLGLRQAVNLRIAVR